jgi:ABC-2 type transport system permease protein
MAGQARPLSTLALWWVRMRAIARKELMVVLLDKRARTTLLLSPILQLLLFGLASTLEVRNVSIGVVNQDAGLQGEALVSRILGSPNFTQLRRYPDVAALQNAIERQDVLVGIAIDSRFSKALDQSGGAPPQILGLADGRRGNAAQIAMGYVRAVIATFGANLQSAAVSGPVNPATGPPLSVVQTNWFNPNLIYMWFTMPSLIAVITVVLTMSVSAQSVAREREFGTFDQILVLPYPVHQIILGKLLPAGLVGIANASLFIILVPLIYGVPFTGAVWLLYAALIFYIFAVVGVGLLVSSLARTQQQAFLGAFMASVPMILLSGYAAPIDNMPNWLQTISLANPARHFLAIVEGLFLKNLPGQEVAAGIVPLIWIACVSLATASVIFKLRME